MALFRCSSGGGGMSTPTLLWTNPSPTVAFSAQTVSVDLSAYNYVIIEARQGKDYAPTSTALIKKGISDNVNDKFSRCYSAANYRTAVTSDSGVAFGVGYNGGTQNNNFCIPTRIWGVNITEFD